MSVSVIIPAKDEELYLNRTIENIFSTATGDIEVVVILDGYNQDVVYEFDRAKEVKVVRYSESHGERVAMNTAVNIATKTHILRIDAHCDFSPQGWDVMMEEVTGEKDLTVAVLTALDKETWARLPGHWYGLCKLLPNMEAKWQKPNRDHNAYKTVEPNMACTGCGMMLRKDFYNELGGADEEFPMMGAIGEEFSVKTWTVGGKVQTRTDVIIGHIFGTSKAGYPTDGVIAAQNMLQKIYGNRYLEIARKFPDIVHESLTSAADNKERRTVIVKREDKTTTKDQDGKIVQELIEYFTYVWIENEEEKHLTEDQVRIKYAPKATKVDEQRFIANDKGELIKTGE